MPCARSSDKQSLIFYPLSIRKNVNPVSWSLIPISVGVPTLTKFKLHFQKFMFNRVSWNGGILQLRQDLECIPPNRVCSVPLRLFLEMCCSEITMARLNRSNVFSHFSHSGVDDMADNTCHFGINNMFADNGLEDGYDTKLYFPCDPLQAAKVVQRTFPLIGTSTSNDGSKSTFTNKGLRFVFTTRSKTPILLKEDGETPVYGDGYSFVPGKDEIIRECGSDGHGYIVSFGDAVYRCLDAVECLKKEGIHVGLINKPTLNVVDHDMMERIVAQSAGSAGICLVVEPLGKKTGVGSKFGSWLMETEHAQKGGALPRFGHIGTHREGGGGLWEQAYHQGYDSVSVQTKIKEMLGKK
mmetsp:Transcript_17063/g.25080  ORF Transcript_17063/g.25080 Transcript_17063/m.25080 type:complete len:354 (+) Transcript_17063:1142-2203(+)